MKGGDHFTALEPDGDPQQSRVFVIVSHPSVIASRSATEIRAPACTSRHGLATELNVDLDELTRARVERALDALGSLQKAMLTDSWAFAAAACETRRRAPAEARAIATRAACLSLTGR